MQDYPLIQKLTTRSSTRDKNHRSATDGSGDFHSMTSEVQDELQFIATSFAPKYKQIVKLELTPEELEVLQILAPEGWIFSEAKKGKKKKNPNEPDYVNSSVMHEFWEKAKSIVKELSSLDTEKDFIYCKDGLLQGTGDVKTLAQVAAKLENGSYIKEGPYSWIKELKNLFQTAKRVYPPNSKIHAVATTLLQRATQMISELMVYPFLRTREKGIGLGRRIHETIHEGESILENIRSYIQTIQPPIVPNQPSHRNHALDRNDFDQAIGSEAPSEAIQRLLMQSFGDMRRTAAASGKRAHLERSHLAVGHFCDFLYASCSNQATAVVSANTQTAAAVEFTGQTLSLRLSKVQPGTRSLLNQYMKTLRYPYRHHQLLPCHRGSLYQKSMLDA